MLTQHGDGGVDLLGGVGVELAEVPALVGDGDVGQGHAQLAVGEVHQLEPAVLERCGARTRSGTPHDRATRLRKQPGHPEQHLTGPRLLPRPAPHLFGWTRAVFLFSDHYKEPTRANHRAQHRIFALVLRSDRSGTHG